MEFNVRNLEISMREKELFAKECGGLIVSNEGSKMNPQHPNGRCQQLIEIQKYQ